MELGSFLEHYGFVIDNAWCNELGLFLRWWSRDVLLYEIVSGKKPSDKSRERTNGWFCFTYHTITICERKRHLQGNSRSKKNKKFAFFFANQMIAYLCTFTSETNSTNKQLKRSFNTRIKTYSFLASTKSEHLIRKSEGFIDLGDEMFLLEFISGSQVTFLKLYSNVGLFLFL
jgi:hypothetical protein